MREEIIDYLKRNRVSTTEVADCLDKSGLLAGAKPIRSGHYKVGKVRWVYAYQESNWTVHEQIVSTEPGEVVLMEGIDCAERALAGELISKYLLLYRQAAAIVSTSPFRDAAALMRENYAIWCAGFSPIGTLHTQPPPLPLARQLRGRQQYDGAIAVCDDGGVVIVPRHLHTQAFLDRLVAIEELEDQWFTRLDRHKESTYDIVCLKPRLHEGQSTAEAG